MKAAEPTGTRRFNPESGTANMLANVPTWTTERIELLKSHFEAGLSCREIAADIGVSRNAVIGKLSRLDLTRGKPGGRASPRQAARSASPNTTPRLQYQMLRRSTKRRSRRGRCRSPASTAARCSSSASKDAAGRSARPAPRISASAATCRSRACPIARATPASPTGPARGSASRVGRRFAEAGARRGMASF